jgi:RNA polymerase sigma-70 factor (ECF subfamily)
MTRPSSVTQLLRDWRSGQADALDRLTPLVYDELKRLADRFMKRERPGHTLQATAIVHEAYERLTAMDVSWVDRKHFFSIAARLMRRILVDHAKQRATDKRAGSVTLFEIKEHDAQVPDIGFGIVEIDQALNQLAAVDRRLADIVEIHYFSGLSVEETATALDISVSTLNRELRTAKAWLTKTIRAALHDT